MESFRKMLTEEGVGILSYQIELPDFDENEEGFCELTAFYRGIAERAARYLETVAAERLRAEYRASEDARKRFSFRPVRYLLSARWEGDRIVRRVTLSRGGKLLFEEETVDLLEGGRVLPQDARRRRKKTR